MDYIERMEQELNDLLTKAEKLEKAIDTIPTLDGKEWSMMYAQLYLMSGYIDVLSKRIQYAKEKESK
nr:hypothetical protein [uncultured Peptostreptococcus sp.]